MRSRVRFLCHMVKQKINVPLEAFKIKATASIKSAAQKGTVIETFSSALYRHGFIPAIKFIFGSF
jgi:hypothetical protein